MTISDNIPKIKKIRYKYGKKLFNREKKKGNIITITDKKKKTHKKNIKEYKTMNSKYKTHKNNITNYKFVQVGGGNITIKKFKNKKNEIKKINKTTLFKNNKGNIEHLIPNIDNKFKVLIYNYYNLISHIAIFSKFSDNQFIDGEVKPFAKTTDLLTTGIENNKKVGYNSTYFKSNFANDIISDNLDVTNYYNICYPLYYMRFIVTENNNFLDGCKLRKQLSKKARKLFKRNYYKVLSTFTSTDNSAIKTITKKLSTNKYIFICEYYKLIVSYLKVNYYHHIFLNNLETYLNANATNNKINYTLYGSGSETGSSTTTSNNFDITTITSNIVGTKSQDSNMVINRYRYKRLKKTHNDLIPNKDVYDPFPTIKQPIETEYSKVKAALLKTNTDTKDYLIAKLDKPSIISLMDIVSEYVPYDVATNTYLTDITQTNPKPTTPTTSAIPSSVSQSKPQQEVKSEIEYEPVYNIVVRKEYANILTSVVTKKGERYEYNNETKTKLHKLLNNTKTVYMMCLFQLLHNYLLNIKDFYYIEDIVIRNTFIPRFLDITYNDGKFDKKQVDANISSFRQKIDIMSNHINNDINLLLTCLNNNTMDTKEAITSDLNQLIDKQSKLNNRINKLNIHQYMSISQFKTDHLQLYNEIIKDPDNSIKSINDNLRVNAIIDKLNNELTQITTQISNIRAQKQTGGDLTVTAYYSEIYKTTIDNTGAVVDPHSKYTSQAILQHNKTGNTDRTHIYYTRVKKEGIIELYNDIMYLLNNPIFINLTKEKFIVTKKLIGSNRKKMYFNYIMKFMMGVIYYDNDLVDSSNPLGDDLYKAKQNFPLHYENYLCQRFFDFNEKTNKEFLNYNNIMHGHLLINKDSPYNREPELVNNENLVKTQFLTKQTYTEQIKTNMIGSKRITIGDYPPEITYFYNNGNFNFNGTNRPPKNNKLLIPQSFLRLNLLTLNELTMLNDRSFLSQKILISKYVKKQQNKHRILKFGFANFIKKIWINYHKKYSDITMQNYVKTLKKIILNVNNNRLKRIFTEHSKTSYTIKTLRLLFNNIFIKLFIYGPLYLISLKMIKTLKPKLFTDENSETLKNDIIEAFLAHYKDKDNNNFQKINKDQFLNIANLTQTGSTSSLSDKTICIVKQLKTDLDILLKFRDIKISDSIYLSNKNMASSKSDKADKGSTASDTLYPELETIKSFEAIANQDVKATDCQTATSGTEAEASAEVESESESESEAGEEKSEGEEESVAGEEAERNTNETKYKYIPEYIKHFYETFKDNLKDNNSYVTLCCAVINYYFTTIIKNSTHRDYYKVLFSSSNKDYNIIKGILSFDNDDKLGIDILEQLNKDETTNETITTYLSKNKRKNRRNNIFNFMGIKNYIDAIYHLIKNKEKYKSNLQAHTKIQGERISIRTIAPANIGNYFGNTDTFEYMVKNNEFNGLDFACMYLNASCTVPNLIQMYRNDLEYLLDTNIKTSDLKTKFDKLLTKIFIFLKLNGLLWDFALSFPERFKDMGANTLPKTKTATKTKDCYLVKVNDTNTDTDTDTYICNDSNLETDQCYNVTITYKIKADADDILDDITTKKLIICYGNDNDNDNENENENEYKIHNCNNEDDEDGDVDVSNITIKQISEKEPINNTTPNFNDGVWRIMVKCPENTITVCLYPITVSEDNTITKIQINNENETNSSIFAATLTSTSNITSDDINGKILHGTTIYDVGNDNMLTEYTSSNELNDVAPQPSNSYAADKYYLIITNNTDNTDCSNIKFCTAGENKSVKPQYEKVIECKPQTPPSPSPSPTQPPKPNRKYYLCVYPITIIGDTTNENLTINPITVTIDTLKQKSKKVMIDLCEEPDTYKPEAKQLIHFKTGTVYTIVDGNPSSNDNITLKTKTTINFKGTTFDEKLVYYIISASQTELLNCDDINCDNLKNNIFTKCKEETKLETKMPLSLCLYDYQPISNPTSTTLNKPTYDAAKIKYMYIGSCYDGDAKALEDKFINFLDGSVYSYTTGENGNSIILQKTTKPQLTINTSILEHYYYVISAKEVEGDSTDTDSDTQCKKSEIIAKLTSHEIFQKTLSTSGDAVTSAGEPVVSAIDTLSEADKTLLTNIKKAKIFYYYLPPPPPPHPPMKLNIGSFQSESENKMTLYKSVFYYITIDQIFPDIETIIKSDGNLTLQILNTTGNDNSTTLLDILLNKEKQYTYDASNNLMNSLEKKVSDTIVNKLTSIADKIYNTTNNNTNIRFLIYSLLTHQNFIKYLVTVEYRGFLLYFIILLTAYANEGKIKIKVTVNNKSYATQIDEVIDIFFNHTNQDYTIKFTTYDTQKTPLGIIDVRLYAAIKQDNTNKYTYLNKSDEYSRVLFTTINDFIKTLVDVPNSNVGTIDLSNCDKCTEFQVTVARTKYELAFKPRPPDQNQGGGKKKISKKHKKKNSKRTKRRLRAMLSK